jgi:hypothetical protein
VSIHLGRFSAFSILSTLSILSHSHFICTDYHRSERSPALPTGWFNWIRPAIRVPDTHVLNHGSLDGFLFLRFLKKLCIICLVGCIIIWPVLIPLNIVGGNEAQQLDAITFGNVKNPVWYYAHAVQAWLFFGKRGFHQTGPFN